MLKQRKNKVIRLVLMLLIFVLLSATTVVAQPLQGSKLVVSIWPEYDEPGVLVIYTGEIKNNSSEPFAGRVVLNIPAGVMTAEMVCETEQGMVCMLYEIEQKEGYAEVSWQVSKPIEPFGTLPYMAEFYYDPIEGEVDKSISYDFIASFDIDQVTFDVKEPFDASNFKIEPVFNFKGADSYGFGTYGYTLAGMGQGENQVVEISYTRASDEPSIDRELATGAAAGQQNLGAGKKSLNSTTIVLLVAFLGLMGFFVLYALKGNRDNRAKKDISKVKPKKKQAIGKTDKAGGEERKKVRKLLLEGKISEDTYKELIEELDKNG